MPETPRLATIPLFDDLIRNPRLARRECIVYGVIAAFHRIGYAPRVPEISQAAGITSASSHRSCMHALRKLEDEGLLVRVKSPGLVTRYELRGPNYEAEGRAA